MDNITIANFGASNRSTTTDPLFQYDYGQILKIEGLELPVAYEVHFSNSPSTKNMTTAAITQIGNINGVTIPNSLLLTGKPVYAWIYLHTGLNDGETEYKITIPVYRRAQIYNPDPIPEQADVISQTIAALDNAVELTAADVVSADNAANAAAGYALSASDSATIAINAGASAYANAEDARSYKNTAVLAKDRAEQVLVAVSSLHDETNEYKIEARNYADIAKASAAEASSQAGTAGAHAFIASQASEAARGYMQLALGYSQDTEAAKNEAYSARNIALSAAGSASVFMERTRGFTIEALDATQTATTSASLASTSAASAQHFAEVTTASAELTRINTQIAVASASSAATNALITEGYTIGKQNNVPVESDSPYYENNSKYYFEHARDSAAEATSAASIASVNASKAEGFAVGKQDNIPVDSSSSYYHHNAEYYAAQAEAFAQQAAAIVEATQAAVASALYIVETFDMESVNTRIEERGNNLYFDDDEKLLYLMSDDIRIGDGVAVAGGGGGGGGGGTTYTIKLVNLLDNRNITVAQGSDVILKFEYTSVDDEDVDDGPGIGSISINGVVKQSLSIPQGENDINIASLLSNGLNTVVVKVENSEGTTRSLKYSVNVISLILTTTFAELASYSGEVRYAYTPTGSGEKTIYFVMDGVTIGTDTVVATGRSQTFTIPEQSYGGHIFECYAVMEYENVYVISNILRHAMLWLDSTATQGSIVSTFNKTSAIEGETLSIPYLAYDPLQENAAVTLTVFNPDNTQYSTNTITVDRLPHTWNINDYPSGNITIRLSCGSASCIFPIEVEPYTLPVDPITDGLLIEFSATGRSNGEANPASWSYGTTDPIVATFSGFGWTGADGWVDDDNGTTVLRFLPNDEMTIPFKPFASDARETGYTIEVDMATRDVRDYESVVLSCMNGGRGFRIASQEAKLTSEQSAVSMLFKEDARVRVAFSIEDKNLNRLVYIYINGVMCGVTQYPVDDNFQQTSPVGFTIGAESCGLDLYRIRCYNKGLTRSEQLDNFIVDRSTLLERQAAFTRNNILNESDEIVIDKLPSTLPYMVVKCVELPQYKGDKKSGVEVTYTDPLHSNRNWIATGVEMDVQGTSSAGYPVKNYKIKLKNGITFVLSGETESGFEITDGDLPTKTICFKADFASSENANNVVLAKFYNDVVPYQTPPQEEDERIRQGIDGFGIALFWQNSITNEITFISKGNCNIDKGNENIFGFTDDYPYAQSWEFKNNTSNRVLFKSANFSGDDWLNDFEARYPEDYTDPTALARVVAWVASTDRDAVDSAEDKAARLEKFVNEFEQYFIKSPMLFYYLFTEAFLMVDNRAKNMFLTTYDGVHWFGLPYDFDTALGINNEGALVFGYNLEDTDQIDLADVYNGQNSVLWKNIRDGFSSELKTMYNTLRSMSDADGSAGSPFSYAKVAKRFNDHQSVWPEALWNEDAFIKYLQPYLLQGENYLSMLQGNKASQRDWWLFNRFRYLDSKYQCGDAASNYITLRCYAVGDITVTPYADLYPRVKYGSYTAFCRGARNQSYVMVCGLDQMNDTEVYIYSADRLASVGDLSALQVGYANFSMATKLQSIKVGDTDSEYENTRLKEFYVGNNDLLTTVNLANCSALGTDTQRSIDLSGCMSLEEVDIRGTALQGINLPVGGHLTTLLLPETLTNFTIRNQANLETLSFEGNSALETLRVENTPNVPIETLINISTNLGRVRLVNVEWTATDATSLEATYDKLITCGGMDASGANTPKAVVSGTVYVDEEISSTLLNNFTDNFPDLLIIADGEATCTVRFRNWDGTILNTQTCGLHESVLDPVLNELIDVPTRPVFNRIIYTYSGWDKDFSDVTGNMIITAVFDEITALEVKFYNSDLEHTLLYTAYVASGDSVLDPVSTGVIDTPTKPTDAQGVYTYSGWDSALTNITSDKIVTAVYQSTPAVSVTFKNWDETVLIIKYTGIGEGVSDPVESEEIPVPTRPNDTSNQIRYSYNGWDTSLSTILEDLIVTATYNTVQYYVVTFKNPVAAGGTTLYVENVDNHGTVIDPVIHGDIDTPTREPEPTYNYIYKGWDAPMSTNVTMNLTYTALYKTDRQFTVTFYNYDGVTVLDSQLIYDEADAIEPIAAGRIATPTRASTPQYSYTFNGWGSALTFITADRDILATYTESVRQYTYRFLNDDSSVLQSGTVDYGTVVTPPNDPTHSSGDPDMQFTGWVPNTFTITANVDYAAIYINTGTPLSKYLARTMTAYESNTATTVAPYAFYEQTVLQTVETSAVTIGEYAFNGCSALTTVDLTSISAITIAAHAFNGATALTHLVIRSTTVSTLSSTNALSNTNIASGYGAIYVPADLVDTYKGASNWSTYANQIYPISAYPMTDFSTISDSWAEIFAAESDGTYTTKYSVGDTKQLSVNGELVYAQIAAIDADTLSAGGTAKITWILKNCLSTTHRMNATNTNANGWPVTEMRTWLRDTILPTIDATIRSNIKTVSKTSYDKTTSADLMSDETIWLPSAREVFGGSTYEQSGPIYSGLFTNDTTRTKRINSSAARWWLRSAGPSSSQYFRYVSTTGTGTTDYASGANGVAFGFCT